jgi:hypothetical protein
MPLDQPERLNATPADRVTSSVMALLLRTLCPAIVYRMATTLMLLCCAVTPAAAADAPNPAPHWAFQPVRPQTPPVVHNTTWPLNDVDRFILAKLEQAGLSPAPGADRRTLIRRATFDLIGLPPTPEEVKAFVDDPAPDAYEKLIERLLASPHYGERWGRYWLDLARYADTNGSDENYTYPNAWRYRDYVVRAFNGDKPYDRFVAEQIAGDLLPADSPGGGDERGAQDRLVATGYLVIGPKMLAEQDKPKLVMDVVDEQIDVVGQTFLGLSLGCARCHDHKYDPVSIVDYYAMAGVFKSTRTMGDLGFVSLWNERELPSASHQVAVAEHAAKLAALRAEAEFYERRAKGEIPTQPEPHDSEGDLNRAGEVRGRLAALEAAPPAPPMAMAVAAGDVQDVPVHLRGSHLTLADSPTPRGLIRTLDACVPPEPVESSQSGRLELARWLTHPANPLTSRVMVNRIWQGHFGVGIVSSPSNFGLRGEPPTHPELLDWLAAEFVRQGWSVKQMHRLIMRSNAYRMSSIADERARAADPENRLLSRQNRRRLEAEPIRDALLAVGGNLDLTIGGGFDIPTKERYARLPPTDPVFMGNRRAIYIPIVRGGVYEMFTTFDYADAGVHLPRRPVTTVPQQALFMLNSELAGRQAELLAKRLLGESGADDGARLGRAYELLYGRPPTGEEASRDLAYVAAAPVGGEGDAKRLAAWTSLCRILLAANEFVYVN